MTRGGRILYVHNSADIYGASRSLLRLLAGWRGVGVTPVVVVPERGPLIEALEALGVEPVVDPFLTVIDRRLGDPRWLLRTAFRYPRSVWRLRRLIRELGVGVVHTNTGVIASPGMAARLARVPHIWHFREIFSEFPGIWPVYSRYVLAVTDRVLAISGAVAEQFPSRRRVTVLHNALPLEEWDPPSTEAVAAFRTAHGLVADLPVVGCVGRIKFHRKGQEHLVAAAAILKARGIRARYLLVGGAAPGSEDHVDKLRELADGRGVLDDFVLSGEVRDPRPAYGAMSVSVLTSVHPEPLGGVVLESMACGVPVVGTDGGGVPEMIVDGESGFLVPPGDPEALADRLERLLTDPELRRRMSVAGRRRVESAFSFDGMFRRLRSIYGEVAPGVDVGGAVDA